jgi:hypothetical protein
MSSLSVLLRWACLIIALLYGYDALDRHFQESAFTVEILSNSTRNANPINEDSKVKDVVDFDDPEILNIFEAEHTAPLGRCKRCGKAIPGISSADDPNKHSRYTDFVSYMRLDGRGFEPDKLCKECYGEAERSGSLEDLDRYVATIRLGKPNKKV